MGQRYSGDSGDAASGWNAPKRGERAGVGTGGCGEGGLGLGAVGVQSVSVSKENHIQYSKGLNHLSLYCILTLYINSIEFKSIICFFPNIKYSEMFCLYSDCKLD